jgi:hypothetical protein
MAPSKRFKQTVSARSIPLAVAIFLFAFTVIGSTHAASTANFKVEIIPGPECYDGLDNDGDGHIDYPDDTDCDSTSDNSESEPVVVGPSPSNNNGGSGGLTIAPSTSVTFSGRAYPGSLVVLLKDGQVAVSTVAGPDAKFDLGLTGISAGSYMFALYGRSTKGRRSRLYTFPISLTKGAITNISGIIIAPTIDVNKSVVRQGNPIAIFGEAAPNADVMVQIFSDQTLFLETQADADGVYLAYFDTSPLHVGDHNTRSLAALDGLTSEYSTVVAFTVGTADALKGTLPACGRADLNCDGRVNLIDFSIAAYWYRRPLEGDVIRREAERLNADGSIDIVDFSIMAFYWTG